MIEHLAVLINTFPGAANQTRCFAHILNLVAKSVLRQFEAPKAKGGKVLDDAARELATVFDELEDANNDNTSALNAEGNKDSGEGNDEEDDDVVDDDEDGLPDERDGMSEEELESLEASVKPIQHMLTKVSPFKFFKDHCQTYRSEKLRGVSSAIKNSSTIVLPRWYEVLESLSLKPRMMPHDVSTRWNSTYDMLEFAAEYRAALNTMTADRDMNLRQFELGRKEWGMATELCEALRVCLLSLSS
jgi:hypothetical protein